LPPKGNEAILPSDTNKPAEANGDSDEFLKALMDGVRKVLDNRKANPSERMAAVNAGVKLLAIRHKISDGDGKGFFD
jgi:hypothetical protein